MESEHQIATGTHRNIVQLFHPCQESSEMHISRAETGGLTIVTNPNECNSFVVEYDIQTN